MADETSVTIFKSLADPTRLEIVRKLVKEEDCASCSKVSRVSSLSQPAMSHHFAKLVDAGVLLEAKEGKEKIYTLNTELLASRGLDPYKL